MLINYVEVFRLDNGENELLIKCEDEICPYQLFWTYDNDVETLNRTKLIESSQKKAIFKYNYNLKRRNFFIVEFSDGTKLLTSYRILPIKGLYNFRDIGGYLTESNRRIKWGVGYRSDYLRYLDDDSMEYIKGLGINLIIDLRKKSEVETQPNRGIGERETIVLDPQAETAEMAGSLQSTKTQDYDTNLLMIAREKVAQGVLGDQQMIDQQLSFVTNENSKKAFSEALKALAKKENSPSLQHCRGGKDRTGFALMLLEGVLGVKKEDLVHDYMLTKRARAKKNQIYYQRFLDLAKDEKVAEYMYALFEVKESYILASINWILDHYNSIKEYCQVELAISDEEIKQLEAIYLE